jgi:hypothetical protein
MAEVTAGLWVRMEAKRGKEADVLASKLPGQPDGRRRCSATSQLHSSTTLPSGSVT